MEEVKEKAETQEKPVEKNVTRVRIDGVGPIKETVHKVDLSKPPAGVEDQAEAKVEEAVETPAEEAVETPAEEVVENQVEEPVVNNTPENVQKLIDFINETGGDINDYVTLNRDVNTLDVSDVMDEYYKETKPHLTAEERQFLLEETFGFDEDLDDEKEIKRKKIALKEQEAAARKFLEEKKSKYYAEIKAGDNLTAEQKKAVDFFNRYNKESEEQKQLNGKVAQEFRAKTDAVFNGEFKGFEYQVGDKKLQFEVKNPGEVKTKQLDINNFINKFVGEGNAINDAAGYHKGLYTAMNADAIAQHFYEQGKADAIKESVANGKNVNVDARKTHSDDVIGPKVRAVDDGFSGFKIRKRKR